MMRLNGHFNKFLSVLTLDQSRAAQAKAAHLSLRDHLLNDPQIQKYLYELFLQGSYAQDTIIRPRHDQDEFDVDVVTSLDVSKMPIERQSPKALVAWLLSRIVTDEKYIGRVRQRTRCIRITFSGLFHLDVVAAKGDSRSGNEVMVPDRELNAWVPSHPKGYTAWIDSKNQETGSRCKRVVKILKCWNKDKVGEASAPKSIVLQTLIGHYCPKVTDSDAGAVVGTFDKLRDTLSPLKQVPRVRNPVVDEDLARTWTQAAFDQFKDHLSRAATRARTALEHVDEARSVYLWKEVFGERFPSAP